MLVKLLRLSDAERPWPIFEGMTAPAELLMKADAELSYVTVLPLRSQPLRARGPRRRGRQRRPNTSQGSSNI
jgi:hypothetical protein